MVYFGPSRGCETCKRGRKKCDETRPSCLRCTNAKRTCGGYEEGATYIFRPYEGHNEDQLPSKSIARKCSLPIRMPSLGTGKLPDDNAPKEVSQEQIEMFALRAFFYDYCVVSSNGSVSRGYLHGLEKMLRQVGLGSDLAKACKAVAFANHGIKLRRPILTRKAQMLYHDLLGSVARSTKDPALANTTELLIIVVLLGLYEMLVADECQHSYHEAHARGIFAILNIENSSLGLFGVVHLLRPGHPFPLNEVPQNCGVFSKARPNSVAQSLDDLLLTFGPIWKKADAFLKNRLMIPHDVYLLMDEAISLNQNLAQWQLTQGSALKPQTVGYIGEERARPVGFWPGKVDTYFDLYVAGVWNASRTARLLLIDLILKLSATLNDNQDHSRELQDALNLVEGMVASIPFHLAEDLQVFLRDLEKRSTAMSPGRPVGGLLLMHPLYIISNLPIVPPSIRQYTQECLVWIGTYMGIGQASLLTKRPEINTDYISDGYMLVWAGTLV